MVTKYALIGCAALALVATVQTSRIERLKPELHDAKQLNETYRKAFVAVKADAQATADQCQARVDRARASARRIETIIERPVPNDANGCPTRPLLSGDELRQTLQPGTNPAEPLR
jgi:hypothetical protein